MGAGPSLDIVRGRAVLPAVAAGYENCDAKDMRRGSGPRYIRIPCHSRGPGAHRRPINDYGLSVSVRADSDGMLARDEG